MRPYFLSVTLLSGSIIAYEIALVRLFSIVQWHHFAHMIISLALLGFGASGTVISLTQRWLMPRFRMVYTTCGIAYSVALVVCFVVSQWVPFNPLLLVWQPSQMLSLSAMYLILSVPFFFGAVCIGIALLQFTEQVNRLYFFDLLGSGIGALGMIALAYALSPEQNLTAISAIGFCSILIANLNRSQMREIILVAIIGCTFISYLLLNPLVIKISPYKGLSGTLNFPDAEILSERYSPLGVLHVVKSQSIRSVLGLSLGSQHSMPSQLGLFTDADSMTAITNFKGDLSQLPYLDDVTSALAYHLIERPHVLVLGAGGGSDVLNALYHNAASIDAVELNSQVIELVEKEHGDFSGHIYAPNSSYPITVYRAEARGYVQSTSKKYDLIQIALLDSVSASASGTHALGESYLYTVEAITELFRHLTPKGMVSITRWLKTPPRDMVRLFATAVEALEHAKGQIPAEQLVFIRGWQTGTLLIRNGRFDQHAQTAIQTFCRQRSFDTAYYPNMPTSEANRYNQLVEPVYFQTAQAILSENRAEFYQQYPFDIRPATDNRPYFFQFLRLGSLIQMIRTIGRNALPFIEWGYLLLVGTLIQAVLAGLVLICLPLFFFRRSKNQSSPVGQTQMPSVRTGDRNVRSYTYWRVLSYFLSLGVGFMFIEMVFIQKFTLLLTNPTYAVAVVLSAFLVFAGIGSLCCLQLKGRLESGHRLFRKCNPISVAIGLLSFISVVYLLCFPTIFRHFLASPEIAKICLSILLIAPLAFFMGMPFPLGISALQRHHPALIAWAWGINGYASVVSAILATCLAIALGFNMVIFLAIGVYIVGAWVSPHVRSSEQ